jgi:hypothetical protein
MFFVQAGRALRKCNFRTPDHLYVKSSMLVQVGDLNQHRALKQNRQ